MANFDWNEIIVTNDGNVANEQVKERIILVTGEKGDNGKDGRGILKIRKSGVSGKYVTFTIEYDDGTRSNFTLELPSGQGGSMDTEIIAEEFDSANRYYEGYYVTYNGKLYQFLQDHLVGEWNPDHVRQLSVMTDVYRKANSESIAEEYVLNKAYHVGDFVMHNGDLYRFTAEHQRSAPWDLNEVELCTVLELLPDDNAIAPDFDVNYSYGNGDYVMYNGGLYKCIWSHQGAWNPDDFEKVTIIELIKDSAINIVARKFINNIDYDVDSYVIDDGRLCRFVVPYQRGESFIDKIAFVRSTDEMKRLFESAESKIAPMFDENTNYAVGDLVRERSDVYPYNIRLYEFVQNHPAGEWDGRQVIGTTIERLLKKCLNSNVIASDFNTHTNYQVGDYVIYDGKLYRFTVEHTSGAWIGIDAVQTILADYFVDNRRFNEWIASKANSTSLADEFSASDTYAVGDYVMRNGMLYKTSTAHTGAWDVNHFIQVNVTDQLITWRDMNTKANSTIIAPEFSESVSYNDGDYVTYRGDLYRFIISHTGAWDLSEVHRVDITDMIGGGRSNHVEYYVSTSGNNNHDGDETHPFRSISKAVNSVSDSQTATIYIDAGTYTESNLHVKGIRSIEFVTKGDVVINSSNPFIIQNSNAHFYTQPPLNAINFDLTLNCGLYALNSNVLMNRIKKLTIATSSITTVFLYGSSLMTDGAYNMNVFGDFTSSGISGVAELYITNTTSSPKYPSIYLANGSSMNFDEAYISSDTEIRVWSGSVLRYDDIYGSFMTYDIRQGSNIWVGDDAPMDGKTYGKKDGEWSEVASAWGDITGTLNNQTDLKNALALKAPLASPTFTGTPKAPTASKGTNTTQLATTAFVQTAIADKQDVLTFDTTPTAGSTNPVTSGGLKTVLDDIRTETITYYVNWSTGSDNNNGTQSAPFKSIRKATDSAPKTKHTNIIVKGGTSCQYAESLNIVDKDISVIIKNDGYSENVYLTGTSAENQIINSRVIFTTESYDNSSASFEFSSRFNVSESSYVRFIGTAKVTLPNSASFGVVTVQNSVFLIDWLNAISSGSLATWCVYATDGSFVKVGRIGPSSVGNTALRSFSSVIICGEISEDANITKIKETVNGGRVFIGEQQEYYSQSEIDALLADKADTSDIIDAYTKTEVDDLLEHKADGWIEESQSGTLVKLSSIDEIIVMEIPPVFKEPNPRTDIIPWVGVIQLIIGATSDTDQTGESIKEWTIGSSSDYFGGCTFYPQTGKLLKTWGYIASYNNETLPGEWRSNQNTYVPGTKPSTGARVLYELAEPIESTISPIFTPTASMVGKNLLSLVYYFQGNRDMPESEHTVIKTTKITGIKTDLKSYIDEHGGTPSWGHITGTLSDQLDLQTALTDKADVITASASGNPVTITDGSPAPVVDLTVGIEPIQNLHGVYPYPAGIGKNLIPDGTDTDKGFEEDKYLKSDGSVRSNTNMDISEYFPVSPSTVYGWKKYSPQQGTSASLCYYDANKNFLSGEAYNDRTDFTTTSPSTAAFARVTILKNPLNSTLFKEGNDYPAVYEPYANICPIIGWTGANTTRTGKNYLETVPMTRTRTADGVTITVNEDGSVTINGTVNSSATVLIANFADSSASNSRQSDNKKHLPNGRYRKSMCEGKWRVQVYGSNVENAGSTDSSSIAGGVEFFTIDDTYKYNWCRFYVSAGAAFYNETFYPWICKQDECVTYPITFPTEAGTVYGGSMDVTTGVLTVDRTNVKLLSSWSWAKSSGIGDFYLSAAVVTDILQGKAEINSRILCSHAKFVTTSATKNIGDCWNNKNYHFYIISNDNSLDDWKDYLDENDVYICYYLATPITYQLTPTEVTTLLGENIISANTGTVNVIYRADTKTYIDQKIAESQRATRSLIAGIETEMVATKNYSIGDLLIVGDTLYKVTANIANGSAITVGTNVTATTVAEQLILLANA